MADDFVSYADQLEAVRRELRLRASVYPRRVGAGKMTQALADRELANMRAVERTLATVLELGQVLEDAQRRALRSLDEVAAGQAEERRLLEALTPRPPQRSLL